MRIGKCRAHTWGSGLLCLLQPVTLSQGNGGTLICHRAPVPAISFDAYLRSWLVRHHSYELNSMGYCTVPHIRKLNEIQSSQRCPATLSLKPRQCFAIRDFQVLCHLSGAFIPSSITSWVPEQIQLFREDV